jgi:23S rRNA pseudouridine1911/1915/1917 synthase
MKPFGSDNIILCDNHILVVDKPAEVATQPDLVQLAKAWVKQKFNKPGGVFLEPIHRLDKPVSGLVLFARTSKALARLQEQMRERQIEKIYEAWVEGCPQEKGGTLRHHLLHGSFRAEISPQGKEAILEYQVLKHKQGRTHLHVVLRTGRYHQIRAQLSAIGCPILGDTKYGSHTPWPQGIALCATQLSFHHPVTKKLINMCAALHSL